MSIFSKFKFFNLANFFSVYIIYDGSFFLPLLGSGDKKGLSVSINNLSVGIILKVF